MTISTEVSTMRLDGSKAAFDKRWGYGALESIKETSPLHGFGEYHMRYVIFYDLSDGKENVHN